MVIRNSKAEVRLWGLSVRRDAADPGAGAPAVLVEAEGALRLVPPPARARLVKGNTRTVTKT